jgi:histidinol-phosphate aminotransferase
MRNVAKIVEERERFYAALTQLDWLKSYPSQTNFILCKVAGGRQAVEIKQKLTEQGILVRHYSSPGLTEHLRFSIGTREQMVRLTHALKQF